MSFYRHSSQYGFSTQPSSQENPAVFNGVSQFPPSQSQFSSPAHESLHSGAYFVDLNSDAFDEEVVYDSQLPSDGRPMQPEMESTHTQSQPQPQPQPPDRGCARRNKRSAHDDSAASARQSSTRFHWDSRSTVVLIEVKRAHEIQRYDAGVGGRSKTLEEQWCEIVAVMAGRGILVDWKAAYDKWKRLVTIHKEISDWERNTPSGKNSYWLMTARERKDEGKFGNLNFDKDVFDMMERFYGHDPVVNPPSSIVDSSNNQYTPSPTPGAQGDAVEETFEHTPTNGGVAKKARKRTHVYDVGLKEATRDIARALEGAEEAKNARQKEVLDLERTKIEIGLRSAMSLEGLSNALNRIADKMH